MRTGDVVDGRYQLEDARGSGSGGIVWTAFDRKLKRTVALKRPHTTASQADRLQFRQEAEIAAQVHHPHAISVFDTVDGDECWLVMEYSPAENLDTIVARTGPLPAQRVARVGVQIAAALAALHAKRIVHRDVKPGNILLDDQDFAKITDFGISIWRQVTQTDDGSFAGTPAYAAPEVASGRPATAASDVFSLGATLFAAVEGVPPFGTGEPADVLRKVRAGEMLPMRHAGRLAPVLSSMLAPEPGKRPTADEVQQRLQDIAGDWVASVPPARASTSNRPFWSRPRFQVITAVALVLSVGLTVFLSTDPPLPASSHAPTAGTGLVGDERTVDPCALLDRKVLDRFGPTELDPTYGNFNRCDVLVNTGGRESVDVEVQMVTRVAADVHGEPLDVIVEQPSDSGECDRTMLLDDKYAVRITASMPNPAKDLCAIADTAVHTAKDAVTRGPLPRRAVPLPADSLAQVDACPLLDDKALAALPAIDPKSALPDFGGWACKWYSPVSPTQVHLRYDQHAAKDPIPGERVQLGDHTAYIRLDIDSGTSCTVTVRHEPASQQWRSVVDLMMLTVKGDRPGDEYCTPATALATAAAAKLPR
ncbi:serine/threonine-protein kinase [Kibdelosporangium persicum]|uniref:Serine/threonine-protein kinase PrkC n=1 Tax=Kibdelosporangium persicum TaxID=2698649 RepID=A0ABX2FJ01_9PSEU|nr:serine/threonine-protein kinase [Kibdelosporangium persicum]NRN71367.1 Serine/threonine-protein kinase PrkC [Kibdelosporangium persicum]